MILELKKGLVEKAADYIEKFFPNYYGSIAATLLEKNPFKYLTRVSYDKNIKGVISFYLSDFNKNKANIVLLAGDNESIGELLKSLMPLTKLSIKVPVNLDKYIENLKYLGFNNSGLVHSEDLDEKMLKLVKDLA